MGTSMTWRSACCAHGAVFSLKYMVPLRSSATQICRQEQNTACRLAAAEKQAAQERAQFRDLEERLLRTEQFADSTMASETKAREQVTRLEGALTVSSLCGEASMYINVCTARFQLVS